MVARTMSDRVSSGRRLESTPARSISSSDHVVAPSTAVVGEGQRHRRICRGGDPSRESSVQVVHRLEVRHGAPMDVGLALEPQDVRQRGARAEAVDLCPPRLDSVAVVAAGQRGRERLAAAIEPHVQRRDRQPVGVDGNDRRPLAGDADRANCVGRCRAGCDERLPAGRQRRSSRSSSGSCSASPPSPKVVGTRVRPEPSTLPSSAMTDALHAVLPRSMASAFTARHTVRDTRPRR